MNKVRKYLGTILATAILCAMIMFVATTPASGQEVEVDLTGQYLVEDNPGSGFNIFTTESGTTVYWFTYGLDNSNRWFVSSTSQDPLGSEGFLLFEPNGVGIQPLDSVRIPGPVGTLTLTVDEDGNPVANYEFPAFYGAQVGVDECSAGFPPYATDCSGSLTLLLLR